MSVPSRHLNREAARRSDERRSEPQSCGHKRKDRAHNLGIDRHQEAFFRSARSPVSSPVAMRMTLTALPMTSAGRFSPSGSVGSPVLQPRGPDEVHKLAPQSRTFDLTCVVSIAPKRSDDFRDRRYLPRPCQLKGPFQGSHSVIHNTKHSGLSGAARADATERESSIKRRPRGWKAQRVENANPRYSYLPEIIGRGSSDGSDDQGKPGHQSFGRALWPLLSIKPQRGRLEAESC